MKNKNNSNIDVITKYFYPVTAGIETNILETYSELVKMGWSVTIHTTKDTYTEKNILKENEELRGLKIKRYKFTRFNISPEINWQKTNLVCIHNFNIFPHFFILAWCFILKIVRQKKFKLILIPHGGFTPEWSIFSRPIATVKKFYHYSIGTFLINSVVDAVRAVSLWEKNQIISKKIRKNLVHIISNGIENEAYLNVDKLANREFKKKVNKLVPYIVQIGRIYKIKNIETSIRALSLVRKDIKLVLVGPIEWKNSGYLEKLKKLINKLNLRNRVIFFGVIRGVEKYFLIKNAELMVHMAIWESFCNVVHEGMSQGLTCIVANNTALPLLIKDGVNGYCIDTHNHKLLAEKINFVLKNKNSTLIKQMGTVNKEFTREESWKKIAFKLHKLYS